jgi:hypothetical protein
MTRNTKSILITHYGAWVKQHPEGWDGYFFRVQFQAIAWIADDQFPIGGKELIRRSRSVRINEF